MPPLMLWRVGEPQEFRVNYVGPFQRHDVVVDGWAVPFLDAHLSGEDQVHLTLDRRLGIDLSVEEAERMVPFLADSIAVALGYTCHPQGDEEPRYDPQPRPVRTFGLGFLHAAYYEALSESRP